MNIVCLGLNHQTAPVEVRELFAVSENKLGQEAGRICEIEGIEESVVLSTCNKNFGARNHIRTIFLWARHCPA